LVVAVQAAVLATGQTEATPFSAQLLLPAAVAAHQAPEMTVKMVARVAADQFLIPRRGMAPLDKETMVALALVTVMAAAVAAQARPEILTQTHTAETGYSRLLVEPLLFTLEAAEAI
jgi:hypothetical protein